MTEDGFDSLDVGYETFNGSFQCQNDWCDETVNEARFDPETKKLTWQCSLGHGSWIKDFTL